MIEKVFGWGKEHGRLAHIVVQVALQIALWSLVYGLIGASSAFTASLYRQDFPILLFGGAALLVIGLSKRQLPPFPDSVAAPAVAIMGLTILIASGVGTWLVFFDYPLTRDEILADFDAASIASGGLIGNPPGEWRPYLDALMPQFMLEVPSQVGWLSAYLPGNAALRAIGELTVGMEWVNPVLASLSIFILFAIGRRLWPQPKSAALVAALLAASSAQVLVMAMTPFAMTAHLAFNLIWLWGFLRGDRRGDACAIAAGFVATGLHQLIFHPLFVAPFILHMWLRGERRRALTYVAAYVVIGLFWASYWQIILAGSPAGEDAASATGLSLLVARVAALFATVAVDAPVTMGFNLLRFIAWQNLALLPFAVAAWPAIRNDEGIARPLAAGIVLTLAAMLVLLPWQGLGWGYRYLHGLIGSFCLLAGYGWNTARGEDSRRFMLVAATAATLLIVPIQLKHAYDYAAPRARAFAIANKTDADIVLIVPAEDLFDDLVRNAPDLSNGPKMMDLRRLTREQIEALCGRYRVAVFDIRHGVAAGLPPSVSRHELERYSAKPERVGCGEPLPLAK